MNSTFMLHWTVWGASPASSDRQYYEVWLAKWLGLLCYIELYEVRHPPVQMINNIKCRLAEWLVLLLYIELFKVHHPPVQMDNNN